MDADVFSFDETSATVALNGYPRDREVSVPKIADLCSST